MVRLGAKVTKYCRTLTLLKYSVIILIMSGMCRSISIKKEYLMRMFLTVLVFISMLVTMPAAAQDWRGLSFGLGVDTAEDSSAFATGEVSYLFEVQPNLFVGPVLGISGWKKDTQLPVGKRNLQLDTVVTGRSQAISYDFSLGIRVGTSVFDQSGLLYGELGYDRFSTELSETYWSLNRQFNNVTKGSTGGGYTAVGYQHRLGDGGALLTGQIRYGEEMGASAGIGLGWKF